MWVVGGNVGRGWQCGSWMARLATDRQSGWGKGGWCVRMIAIATTDHKVNMGCRKTWLAGYLMIDL